MKSLCTRLFLSTVLLLVFACPVYSQETSPEKYMLVEIRLNQEKFTQIIDLGLALDCCEHRIVNGIHIVTVPVTPMEKTMLDEKRVAYQTVTEDAAAYYANRATLDDKAKAEEYRKGLRTDMQLGAMGGYYTWEQVQSTLDALYTKYSSKGLITAKEVIGQTYEGRNIYMIKISDNAASDENTSESQVLYTALHHAREPEGMMTLFYFMYYLLENYETNQRVRSIVDNRELYFIPVINPDGYAYNQKNNPNGGGMWRKNRGPNGTVDLNRNYGPQDLWNYPNGGSSTSSYSDTYRGIAAFSEKETKAVRDFVLAKNFKTTLNYHTYSNLLIYPWGIQDQLADPKFQTMAVAMTKINGYRYGTAEGLLYAVRGVSDDWFFKEAKVFAMTPEVGGSSDGFWPVASRIFPLAQENLEANLLLAEYAGQVK